MNSSPPAMLTPPQIARRLRVKPEKVVGWIRQGELRAINVAHRGSRRPRFRIEQADLDNFLTSRTVKRREPPKRRQRSRAGDVIQFF